MYYTVIKQKNDRKENRKESQIGEEWKYSLPYPYSGHLKLKFPFTSFLS